MRRYREGLVGLPFRWQRVTTGAHPTTWLCALRTPVRNELVAHLNRRGIGARAVWPSLGQQPFLRSFYRNCAEAESLSGQTLWLPTYFDMNDELIDSVIHEIHGFFDLEKFHLTIGGVES